MGTISRGSLEISATNYYTPFSFRVRSENAELGRHRILVKIPHMLFALSLAMCVVMVLIIRTEERPSVEVVNEETGEMETVSRGHGFAHPDFANMQSGGPGQERHEDLLLLGWVFGVLQILFFITCLALGGQKKGSLGPLFKPLVFGGAGFIAIFTALILSYNAYMREDVHSLVLFQVKPTAWMLYGIWGFPVVFIVAYVLTFDKWFMTDDDLEAFRELVAKKRAQAEEETG